MKKYFSFFTFFVLTFSLYGSFFVPAAQAASLSISPPKFEESVNPGDTLYKTVKIKNQGAAMLELEITPEDFAAAKDEGGRPEFIKGEDTSISVSKWIKIDEPHIFVKPQETIEIPFKIEVPKNAEPGGHYGTIFFGPPPVKGQGNISIQQRLGSLILVRVSGDIKEEGKLATFGTYEAQADFQKWSPTPKWFYENAEVNFSVRFENSGNVHLKPEGRIEITDIFGNTVKEVGKLIEVNDQGMVMGEQVVDYVPVNDTRGNVLPKSVRKFNQEWKNLDKTFFGRYTATLNLVYGNNQKADPISVSFWVLPWKLVLAYLGGILLLIALGYLWQKRTKKKMEEKLRMELELAELKKQLAQK